MFDESKRLFSRAVKVIPGGIYGHTSPALLVPGEFPYYADHARGCRYWDVDGNEFIDFLCSYGPIVLGHKHPDVEEVVRVQMEKGNCFNHPTEKMVELAERLVSLVNFADWSVFAKNGSDVTTWTIQVARAYTHRKKLIRLAGSYHGAHAWCTPGHHGLIEEDRAHVHEFVWNDPDSLRRMTKIYRDQIAAVIITPYHHPSFAEIQMPAEGFLQEVESLCREKGILLILDDIRGGFRLNLEGSHRLFQFEPDMICFSKALGNGYPISVALGRKELKVTASRVFLTGSYWNNPAPMVAALKCLDILQQEQVPGKLKKMGDKLARGLEWAAQRHGQAIRITGPAATPFMTFTDETNFRKMQAFCGFCARNGVFFHPHHNWFLCAAHNESDIEQAVGVAESAFAFVSSHYPKDQS